MTRREKILAFMRKPEYIPLKIDELAAILDVPAGDAEELQSILASLSDQGQIMRSKKGRYSTAERIGLMRGRFMSGKNGGFVRCDDADRDNDIFIPPADTMYAMNGDTVLVRITRAATDGRRREGAVMRITERAATDIVGTVSLRNGRFSLIPKDSKLSSEILLSRGSCADLSDGDSVIARITRYPENGLPAKAKVTEFIGAKDHPATDTSCIIRQFGIPFEFSPKALEQAAAAAQQVLPDEIEGRKDFRDCNIITIDGEDARDLDDAIHIETRAGGIFRLGVHIADVSHYVRENTAIDLDAFDRATSVYFPDRVVPMLPVELSNGICSLNPDVDRLAFSVIMDIAPSGEVQYYKLYKSVIRSKERMTYTDVTALLEQDVPPLKARYAHILPDIENMAKLAQSLKNRRRERGSVDFDFPETKVVIGEDGKVKDILPYKTGIANHIIEEFMLITNETVARYAVENELPFVFRVHEPPNSEKIGELAKFLTNFDVKLSHTDSISPKQMQQVLREIEDMPAKQIISSVMLRSMMKAQYAPQNLGHFGLAAEFYCHFTSPIRRYPDLTIHRILSEKIGRHLGKKRLSHLQDFTQRAAKQSTDMEIRAAEAERDADKLKICEYMQQFIGQEFDAVIVSVTDFGMFVSLPNTAEGLISMQSLADDYYVLDKDRYRISGERTGKVYTLGDPVKVRLVASNPHTRQIDFIPADMDGSPVKKKVPPANTTSQSIKNKSASPKDRKSKNDFRKFAKKKGRRKK